MRAMIAMTHTTDAILIPIKTGVRRPVEDDCVGRRNKYQIFKIILISSY